MGRHAAGLAVVGVVEGAVLPHHGAHGPHAGDMVAPASWAAGDRHPLDARLFQALQRGVGVGRQAAFGGQRVVDVGQDDANRRGDGQRQLGRASGRE
ncbi:hypothetical protein G6F62_015554 [Rhizopus arrhizus]|nr:hypothetical protein G6F62_015554 [Rhizopus arrhizus]